MWVRKGMAGEQGPQEERWAVQSAGWGGGQPWTGKGHPAAKLGERRKKERTGRRAVGVLI